MALVQYGPIVSAVSGSIGGVTFSQSSAGAIARVRRGPLQTISNPRGIVKNRFAFIAKRFSSLDVGAQSLWRSFAAANPVRTRFGGTQILSPIAMYTYINGALMAQSAVVIDTPPGSLIVSGLTEFTIVALPDPGGSITIHTTATASVANEFLQLYLSGPTGSSRTTASVGYYQIPLVNQVAGVTFDVTAAWVARYGVLPQGPGQALLGKVRIVNSVTGGRSPYLTQITNFGATPPLIGETMIYGARFNHATLTSERWFAPDGTYDPAENSVSSAGDPHYSVQVPRAMRLSNLTYSRTGGGAEANTLIQIYTQVGLTGLALTIPAGDAFGTNATDTVDLAIGDFICVSYLNDVSDSDPEIFLSFQATPI